MKTWKIDPVHSEIKFKVKHLVVSTVTGQFNKFDAVIESENDDFNDAKVTFEADINTISTSNEMRDGHLKSADFFDAVNYPKMTFVSKLFKKKNGNKYNMTGDLFIRGIAKEVSLDVIYNGSAKAMDGSNIAAFEIYGKINRFDFGLHWNALTETGGLVVGSDIKLEILAEMKETGHISKAA
jgi:polyisoprenoid-binding protein YceI